MFQLIIQILLKVIFMQDKESRNKKLQALLDDEEPVVKKKKKKIEEPEVIEEPKKKNSRCNSGQVNVLTSSRPSSSMAQATTANTCLVSIKKVDSVKPNLAYQPPVIIGA
jgi:hypothetical protein